MMASSGMLGARPWPIALVTDGPVLDLGAGAARAALHLQDRDRPWGAVLLLCGNLGLGGSWEGNRRLLQRLAAVCAPGALLLGDSVVYSGRAEIGLRIRYGNLVTPWWRQRNVAASEAA